MENDLHKRWRTLPQVEVQFGGILRVNQRHVSLPDISAQTLSDYIEIGKPQINAELRHTGRRERFCDGPTKPRTVLLGRLALEGRESWAFTNSGQYVDDTDDIRMEHLSDLYQGYWKVVEEAAYIPLIQRNFALGPRLSGTWLGVKRPRV